MFYYFDQKMYPDMFGMAFDSINYAMWLTHLRIKTNFFGNWLYLHSDVSFQTIIMADIVL